MIKLKDLYYFMNIKCMLNVSHFLANSRVLGAKCVIENTRQTHLLKWLFDTVRLLFLLFQLLFLL